jgi:predicted transcriptional regulator
MYEILFGSTTKGKILNIISDGSAHSVKEIYANLKQSNNISYQAVHKMIKQMCLEAILVKENSKYKVNQLWVQKLKHASIELELKYNPVVETYNIDPSFVKPINLTFTDFRKLL